MSGNRSSGPAYTGHGDLIGPRAATRSGVAFLTYAFGIMFAGLLVSAFVSALVASSAAVQDASRGLILPIVIGQFALVIALSAGIRRMSDTVALGAFLVFAALEGLMLGLVVSIYLAGAGGAAALTEAFVSASATFGGAALYGLVTRRNLDTLGAYAVMALFGLIAAMLVNFIFASAMFSYAISVAGVLVFVVLTAWDVQRIGNGRQTMFAGSVEKGAVYGALALYLDFVNLFLFFLRIFGGVGRK